MLTNKRECLAFNRAHIQPTTTLEGALLYTRVHPVLYTLCTPKREKSGWKLLQITHKTQEIWRKTPPKTPKMSHFEDRLKPSKKLLSGRSDVRIILRSPIQWKRVVFGWLFFVFRLYNNYTIFLAFCKYRNFPQIALARIKYILWVPSHFILTNRAKCGIMYTLHKLYIFFSTMGKYFGKKCFLSFLIPSLRVCVATFEGSIFSVHSFGGALFYFWGVIW